MLSLQAEDLSSNSQLPVNLISALEGREVNPKSSLASQAKKRQPSGSERSCHRAIQQNDGEGTWHTVLVSV